VKTNLCELYSLDRDDNGKRYDQDEDGNVNLADRHLVIKKVAYLLENDRYICDPKYYDVRFTCTQRN
jgi:hypothetical protein